MNTTTERSRQPRHGVFERFCRRYAARSRYWRANRHASVLYQWLADTNEPAKRSALLALASAMEADMARQQPVAYGNGPAGDGHDEAVSLASRAALLDALASVYAAVAGNNTSRPAARDDIERAAGPVLDRMVARRDPDAIRGLLADLYCAIVPVVGVQAADVVAYLPSPGHRGWGQR